jgi:hypothetical protein
MRAQITLTVNEGKRIIAKAVAALPAVRRALEGGRIFLKGGTTTSAVCEELVGRPLRISGRIVPAGLKAARDYSRVFHNCVIEKGQATDPGEALEALVEKFRPDDVCIVGANAIDTYGQAALMYGGLPTGNPGRIVPVLMTEISNVIIPAGLEKLVPGSIRDLAAQTGRLLVDRSMGMPVGLLPLAGRIVTEKEALPLLADVTFQLIGKGGIFGAEGGSTMIVDGADAEVERIFALVLSIKGSGVSGVEESFPECQSPSPMCGFHRTCVYRRKKSEEEQPAP